MVETQRQVWRGAFLQRRGTDRRKRAVDEAAAPLVATLLEGIAKIAEEQVKACTDELTAEILTKLPDVVALPSPPADVPQERLLTTADVAELLACSEAKVKKRMDAGDLAYIVERGSDRRRIPYSWVVEYIHKHKRYAGPLGKRWEVVE